MRRIFFVPGLFLALAACEPRIYVDEPLEERDGGTAAADAEASPLEPDIRCTPMLLDFGAVTIGATQRLLALCTNAGEAELAISNMYFAGGNAAFTVSAGGGLPFLLQPAEQMQIDVDYTPSGSARDSDILVISSNDPNTPNLELVVIGGVVPRVRVDPPDTLVIPDVGPSRSAELMLSNVGFGDLQVLSLSITGPNGAPDSASVDDFSIAECMGQNPCVFMPPRILCPPMSPSCTGPSSHAFQVNYHNNDVSTVDYAELHIRTNDRADSDHVVVLQATDHPCFYPTPAITVLTPQPCVGQPVELSGAASTSGASAITTYSWSWLFTPASAPAFNPAISATATTAFIPAESGVFVVALDVTNDCGATSQSQAVETINVAALCN